MSAPDAARAAIGDHQSVVSDLVETELDSISSFMALAAETVTGGGRLFFAGNGGSAADAQHLAAEFVGRFEREREPLAAVALTTDTSILTAIGNDYGFDQVFERQVRALGGRGDLLVLHSTSGESENLIRAATAARELGISTAALLAKDGGRLAEHVDVPIVVPTQSTARAQEAHILIGHIVCAWVEERITDGEGQ